MKSMDTSHALCKSTFKHGNKTTKELVTQKWIELINRIEKQKTTKAD